MALLANPNTFNIPLWAASSEVPNRPTRRVMYLQNDGRREGRRGGRWGGRKGRKEGEEGEEREEREEGEEGEEGESGG